MLKGLAFLLFIAQCLPVYANLNIGSKGFAVLSPSGSAGTSRTVVVGELSFSIDPERKAMSLVLLTETRNLYSADASDRFCEMKLQLNEGPQVFNEYGQRVKTWITPLYSRKIAKVEDILKNQIGTLVVS